MERSTYLRAALIVLVAAVSAVLVDWLAVRHHNVDIEVYRGAVDSWVRNGDLYSWHFAERHLSFTYPPFAAVTMTPMLLLPASTVIALNRLVIAAAILFSIRCTVVRLPMLRQHGTWFVTVVVALLVCTLEPVRDTITLGQVDITLVALVFVDLLLLEGGSRFAGVGIGLATAIKLTPGLFIVFLVVAGMRRAAGTACAVFGGVTLFAAALAPGTSWTFWSSTILNSSRVGSYDSATNQSLAGVVTRLTNANHLPAYWLPLVVVVAAWALWSAARLWGHGEHLPALTTIGLASTLASPISWIHHLWWVVPALLIVVDAALRTKSKPLLLSAIVVAALFASGLPDLTRAAQGHHLTALAIVGENSYAVACLALLLSIPHVTRTSWRTGSTISA
jgi:alpha-1,2-mannosyltransferase